jgi:hypothetical protein
MAMGHTSGALRSRNFASSARGLRPDGKSASMMGGEVVGEKDNRTSQAVLGGPDRLEYSL